jgi:hypothetical protein
MHSISIFSCLEYLQISSIRDKKSICEVCMPWPNYPITELSNYRIIELPNYRCNFGCLASGLCKIGGEKKMVGGQFQTEVCFWLEIDEPSRRETQASRHSYHCEIKSKSSRNSSGKASHSSKHPHWFEEITISFPQSQ